MTETEPQFTLGAGRCHDTGELMYWNEAAEAYTHAGRCSYGRAHRHLELTIYPPAPPRPGITATAPEYDAWLEARDDEENVRMEKLLPEACIAAEYWRAKDAENDGDPGRLDWPNGVPTFTPESVILERIARRYHASSTNYE